MEETPKDDLIRRSDALNVIERNHHRLQSDGLTYTILIEQMKLVPKKKDILYFCDRKRCDNCHSECELTSDINHDAGAGAVIIFDKAAIPSADRPQGEWIDAEIPLESGGSMPIQACNLCKTFYPLAYTGGGHRFCPNCGARMKGAETER